MNWSDPRAELGWRHALPAWAWAMIVLAALFIAGRSYSRLLGARPARACLSVVRAMILLMVVVLMAGPVLVLPLERVEPDWLLILVDRSASMTLRDVRAGGDTISRDQQLRSALSEHAAVFERWAGTNDEDPSVHRRVMWLGFDAGTFQIDPPHLSGSGLPPARGQQTLLRTAIEQALQRAAGRPISGLVLMTDGRSPQPLGAELASRLRQQAVEVFPIPLGAAEPPVDLAIGRLDAPDKAMIDDVVPVSVWLERYPAEAALDPSRVRVRLVDDRTGQLLDERSPSVGPDEPVRLTGRGANIGEAAWRVDLVYDGPDPEIITDNNTRQLVIEFVDQPIRVLYVEGYPRWEYRYLKNLLIREKSIVSSVMLIESDREFAQEGDVPIARLPLDRKEMRPYDVVVIGDVPASYWSPDQLTLLGEQVAENGAGLLWIGGEYHTPRSYDLPPLSNLLPMRRPAQVSRLDPRAGPWSWRPTTAAQALRVLELSSGPEEAGSQPRWPEHLPPLYWAQDLGPLKPAAIVLADATAGDPLTPTGQRQPMVVQMRYGAGQSVYVATDETWRWRFGRGDLYFDQFWVQLVQMLGRGRLQAGGVGRRAWLGLSHRRVAIGQTIVVELVVSDPLLIHRLSAGEARVAVGVFDQSRADDNSAAPVDRLELLPQDRGESLGPSSAGDARPVKFRATWQPQASPGISSGRFELRVTEPALADLELAQPLEVTRPDDELLDPAADHPRLAALAEQTGGRVVPVHELDTLPSIVPNRSRKTPADISEPLWHSPLALIVVVLLLTVEWIGRKIIRLV